MKLITLIFKVGFSLLFIFLSGDYCLGYEKVILKNRKTKKINDTIYITANLRGAERAAFYNTAADLYKYVSPVVFDSSRKFVRIISKDTIILVDTKTNAPYMVVPGEHLVLTVNFRNRIIVKDANDSVRTNELMFFAELYNKIPILPLPARKIKDKISFQQNRDYYFKRLKNSEAFLDEYSKEHLLSNNFIVFAKKYLYYDYLSFLFNPALYQSPKEITSDILFFKKDFVGSSIIFADSYKRASYNYALLLKIITPQDDLFTIARKYFSDPTRKYVLYRLLMNKIGEKYQNDISRKEFERFIMDYSSDTLSKVIKDNYAYLLSSQGPPMKKDFSNEELLSYHGNMISWKKILEENKGKWIYVDFWASWCLPCIKEIPISFSLRKKLDTSKISFICVSWDYGKEVWENANSELNFPGVVKSYLIMNPKSSKILDHYAITELPRYLLFNNYGKLVLKNAPRPSDPEITSLFDKYLKQ